MGDELNDFPNISEELMHECKKKFQPYVFYQTIEHGNRECWCSSCGEHFTVESVVRIQEQKHKDFMGARHNDGGECPRCGRVAIIKNIGKSKQRYNLREEIQVAFIIPKDKNKVYIRAYYATKSYSQSLTPDIYLSETSRYILSPGAATMWKFDYDFTNFGLASGRWKKRKTVGEPFQKGIHGSDRGYYLIGIDDTQIAKTFLKYSQIDMFCSGQISRSVDGNVEIMLVKYLCCYAQYPSIEMFMKLGFNDFVYELVVDRRANKRLVNWSAKTPPEAFRMDKQTFNSFKNTDKSVWRLKEYRRINRSGYRTSFEELSFCEENFGQYETGMLIDELVSKEAPAISLSRIINYIKRNTHRNGSLRSTLITWRDYISAAKKINYDLQDEVVFFPKKLKRAHDIAVELYARLRQERISREQKEEREKAEKTLRKLQIKREQKYFFENGDYFIRVPVSIQEVIDEGQALKHCVGGYAMRHAKGKTTILFLRKKTYPDIPYFTIEVWDKEVRQIQGYKNNTPLPEEVKLFFEEWKQYVLMGSEKNQRVAIVAT